MKFQILLNKFLYVNFYIIADEKKFLERKKDQNIYKYINITLKSLLNKVRSTKSDVH